MQTARCLCLFISLALALPGRAESDESEFVPEANVFTELSDRTRLYLLVSLTRNFTEDATDGEIGAHLDVTLKPILRARLREYDWERARYFWIRVGYVLAGDLDDRSDGFTDHTGIFQATARLPLPREFGLVNRFGIDLRDSNGESSKRYRYRLGIERELAFGDSVWVPYAQVEAIYDTRYDDWNRRLYQAGVEIHLTKAWRIEAYVAHQDDERSESGNLNRIGLVLKNFR